MEQVAGMDWALAIERNRDDLLRIVDALFALVGLAEGAMPPVLPRRIYRRVLLVLRPAESAVRRLVWIAERYLVGTATRPAPALSAPAKAPAGKPLVVHRRVDLGLARVPAPEAETPPAKESAHTALPSFALADPDNRFADRPKRPTIMPRVRALDPEFSLPVYLRRPEPPERPSKGDTVDARRLCRRLMALRAALDDIEGHARKLARRNARTAGPRRPPLPLRGGYPPGWRKRPIHDVDEVLRECHRLVGYADSHAPPPGVTGTA
jgi:hypothetical protein